MLQVKSKNNLCLVIGLSCLLFACSTNGKKENDKKTNKEGVKEIQCDSLFKAHFICYFDLTDFETGRIVKYRAGTEFQTILETKEVPIVSKYFKKKHENGSADSAEYWIVQFADSVNSKVDYEVIFQNKKIYKSNKYSKIIYGRIEAGDHYDCVLLNYLNNGKSEERTYFLLK